MGVCYFAAPGRKLLASRAVPYVNITYDFDCFASLSLPTTVAVCSNLAFLFCTARRFTGFKECGNIHETHACVCCRIGRCCPRSS